MNLKKQILKMLLRELNLIHLIPGEHNKISYILLSVKFLLGFMFFWFAFKLIIIGLEERDLNTFADGVVSLCAHVQGYKVLLFFKQADLMRVINASNWFWSSKSTEKIEKNIFRSLVAFRYVVYVAIVIVFYMTTAILQEYPFPGKYPEFRFSFPILGTLQCVQYTSDAIAVIVCDCLFMTTVLMLYAQFELLNERMRSVGNNAKLGKITNGEIEKCIEHHIKLLDLSNHIIKLYTVIMTGQVLVVTIATCLEAFVFESRALNAKIARLFYLMAINVQLALYCLPAEYLSNEAADTSNAIFHSDWFENGYFSKTYVQHIIRRANKPVIFTAGGIVTINKATFVRVFQNFLSITTLLKDLS